MFNLCDKRCKQKARNVVTNALFETDWRYDPPQFAIAIGPLIFIPFTLMERWPTKHCLH